MELFFSIFTVLMVVVTATTSSSFAVLAVADDPDPFTKALLGLKSQLIDSSNSLHDWNYFPNHQQQHQSDKISACSWSGIICSHNSTMIISLDLSNKNLKGPLSPTHVNQLTTLITLNLSHNSFTGKLPPEIFTPLINLTTLDISRNNFISTFPSGVSQLQNLIILDAFSNSFSGPLPRELSKLDSLKVLNLAGSYFQGPIPSSYGSFKNLEFIHLAGNLLSGEIPPELGNLKTMAHMEIGYNSYQGNIPWQLGNMSNLQYLDIAGANLSGSIPNYLSNLTKLETLFLFRNHLTGSIPWGFGDIQTLKSLDLSDNLITGSIPVSFANLRNLRLLSLMYNGMNGDVPEGIAELPVLETLLIWNNLFSGSLPMRLGKNSKLKWVDVSSNGFTGIIPPSICAGGVLSKLILFSNNFTGELSPALTNCSSLVRLRLEDNSFSGKIPLEFNHLNDISYVDLSRNRFTGGIPEDMFYSSSKLEYFNVSQNPDLGGVIPSKIWSLPSLKNFSASSCNISGNLPPFDKPCKSVTIVELNRNILSGSLPNSISNCKSVQRIDLSNNNLTGDIPVELASLPSLSILDLSYNQLTGFVPQDKILTDMGASSYIGNPALCGAPLQPCSDSKEIPRVAGFRLGRESSLKLTWVLLLSSGVVFFIVMSGMAVFYLMKERDGGWRMVAFPGLPRFTAKDVLRSFSSTDSMEMAPALTVPLCKAVLPTGITVSVKQIDWEGKERGLMSDFITLIGNSRHKNLIRLLGFCYNKHVAYLLYDCLPNGNLAETLRMKRDTIDTWATKRKIVIGIAKGLCYLHHECDPPIPHGDMSLSNIVLDENMEPHLAEFGLKKLLHMSRFPVLGRSRTGSISSTGELSSSSVKEELNNDIYGFGEILWEILTNGRLKNVGGSMQTKPREIILQEICEKNEESGATSNGLREGEIKVVTEVALLCTRSRPFERPSMHDILKRLLSGLKH